MWCRHCAQAPVSRPRGLCWTCYYLPGVRDQYPVKYVAPRFGDGYGQFPLPPAPTRARPGSSEKVQVLHRRAFLRCQLWHPLDARLDDE
jgi:hypothetical protein